MKSFRDTFSNLGTSVRDSSLRELLMMDIDIYTSEVLVGKYFFTEDLSIRVDVRTPNSLEMLSSTNISSGTSFLAPLHSSKGESVLVQIIDNTTKKEILSKIVVLDGRVFYEINDTIYHPRFVSSSHQNFLPLMSYRVPQLKYNLDCVVQIIGFSLFLLFLILQAVCSSPRGKHRTTNQRKTRKWELLKNQDKDDGSEEEILVLLLKDESFECKD